MTYELAKQLKDAGFLQRGRGYWYLDGENNNIYGEYLNTPYLTKAPTLSELIEACGKDVILWKNETWNAGTKGNLYDVDGCLDGWVSNHQTAETPEEAVAKLWLEINKK